MTDRFFAPCPRGLEAPLVAELGALGAAFVSPVEGGVGFAGPLELAYRANLESRIASRILWQVAHGRYRTVDDLYRLATSVDWPHHFRGDRSIRVDIAATRSPLTSLEFATLKVKDAVCDVFRARAGSRPGVDKQHPDVRIHAYLTATAATLYLDTSGEPLFKRGYRRNTEEAPLRENLAAGLLALAGWHPGTTLLDPMCGSGTIAIEAALMAADHAPGLHRTFGFQKLTWFDGPAWQRIRQRARDRIGRPIAAMIHASDRDAAAVASAQRNAAKAEVLDWIRFETADVLTRNPPAPAGCVVTNPPYGVRLAEEARLAEFYPRLGDALKRRYSGWSAFLLTGDLRLPQLIGLRPSSRTPLYNGAIECRLYRFEMVAGRPTRLRTNGPASPG